MPHGMRCRHHCEAVMNVAGTPKNRGRVFYRCPFWRDGRADCGFFRWVDQMPKEKERMVVRDTTMEDSNDVAGYLQRNDDPRDTAGERMLEEIRVIKQTVLVLETRVRYVIVCLCLLVVFLGLVLNKME
ncbi:hypothetical protein LINPERHAP1_LOCUS6214 [Linum perenne]